MKETLKPVRERATVIAVLGAALLYKLVYLALYARRIPYYSHQMGDSAIYLSWAHRIVAGDFWGLREPFRVFYRAPLYPYLLALSLKLFGNSMLPVYLAQFALGTFSLLLAYLIARRLFSHQAGVATLILGALYAPLTFKESKLVSVTLVIALLMAASWVLMAGRDGLTRQGNPKLETLNSKPVPGFRNADLGLSVSGWRWFLAGILMGLATLAWGGVILMLPLAALGWLVLRKTGLGFSRVLWLALGCVVMILPATVHNLAVGNDFVLVNSNSGYTFYQGNNRIAVGTIVSPPEVNEQPFNGRFLTSIADQQTFDLNYASLHLKPSRPGQKPELVKPSQASGFWLRQGLNFIAHHPGQYLGLEFQKLILLLSNHEFPSNYYLDVEQNELPFLRVLFVPFALILALAVLGIVATVRDARREKSRGQGVKDSGIQGANPRFLDSSNPGVLSRSWPLLLVISATTLTLLVFYVGMRYRLPLVLPLAVFAGGGLARLVELRRRRRAILPELAITVVPLVISGLLCTIPLNRRLAYTTAQGYRNLGQVWDDQVRNPARAEQMYDKALSIFSSFKTFGRTPLSAGTKSELLYLRGNAFMDQQKYDSAVMDFKNARQANPRMDVVLPKLASAYLHRALAQRQRSPGPARAGLDTALAYARDWYARDTLGPGTNVLLGDIYAARGDTAPAEQAYRAAIRLDSTQTGAWTALGDISFGRGDTAGAIDAYTRASRQDTLNPLPAIKLGTVFGRMGNHVQAQAVFGTMLARLERRPNARQAILRTKNAANYLYLKYLLGDAYLGEREWDKAAGQAQEILDLAPDYRPAQELLTNAQQHRVP